MRFPKAAILSGASSRCGAGLAEVVASWLLCLAALGALAWTTFMVATENADDKVKRATQARARELERETLLILRRASRGAGFRCADFSDWNARAVFDGGPEGTPSSLEFANGALVYDPNAESSGDERTLAGAGAPGYEGLILEEAAFRPGISPDGSPDGTRALVKIQIARAGSGQAIATRRLFAVELKGR